MPNVSRQPLEQVVHVDPDRFHEFTRDFTAAEIGQLIDDIMKAAEEGRSDYDWVVVGWQRRDEAEPFYGPEDLEEGELN